jgi:hypothetical protein
VGKAWYQLVSTLCIILACVFTVAGMLDSLVYSGVKLAKKVRRLAGV